MLRGALPNVNWAGMAKAAGSMQLTRPGPSGLGSQRSSTSFSTSGRCGVRPTFARSPWIVTFSGAPLWNVATPLTCHPPSSPRHQQAVGVPEERQLVDAAEHEPVRHVPARRAVVAPDVEVVDDRAAPVRVVGHVERPRPGVVRVQPEPGASYGGAARTRASRSWRSGRSRSPG